MDILAQELSAKYNIGADGLNGFQRDSNKLRASLGIPEDDTRPYILLTFPKTPNLFGAWNGLVKTANDPSPEKVLIPVEGTIFDMQMKAWGEIERFPKKDGKVNCSIAYYGPRDSVYSSFSPTGEGLDTDVLASIKSKLEDAEEYLAAPKADEFGFGMK